MARKSGNRTPSATGIQTPGDGWRPGHFDIATLKGSLAVEGVVLGCFGIDLRDQGGPPAEAVPFGWLPMPSRRWMVTHLPTGRAIAGIGFVSREQAVAFVARIGGLVEWDTLTPTATPAIAEEIRRIELEVLSIGS